MWRSAYCHQQACNTLLRQTHLEVRLPDIRHDPAVVDLLLTLVHAAATSSNMALLPGCPITTGPNILQALNSMPATSTLQISSGLSASVKRLSASTEAPLSWTCTSYRGFPTFATGVLKIPSMPGAHQFVLANTFPDKQKGFAAHGTQKLSRVVFHSTSLDRVYAILCEVLKICDGQGIYTAKDPSMSLGYSRPPGLGWPASNYKNARVLLGCELSGAHSTPAEMLGIHVVTDLSMLMVRYVFLIPAGFSCPIRAHVEPAMEIAFASLRLGPV